MSEQNAVIAVYETHAGAEEAIKELQRTGVDLHTLSIVGKDTHTDEHVVPPDGAWHRTGSRDSQERSRKHEACQCNVAFG